MKTFTMLFYLLLGSALTVFIYSNFEQSVVVYFTSSYRTVAIPLALALFAGAYPALRAARSAKEESKSKAITVKRWPPNWKN